MAKRRSVIIGIGSIAAGSGVLSASAAFSDNVSPSSDMRVLAAQDLTVAPGASFRDEQDEYDDTLENEFYNATSADFFNESDPSNESDSPLGDELESSDLPAISVNDATDGDLEIQVVTLNNEDSHRFSEVLQVTNDGDSDQNVGVKFETFGADTNGDQDGNQGQVDEQNVVSSYVFEDSGENQISTSDDHFGGETINDVSDQQVHGTVTIGSGDTEQIDLVVELDEGTTGQIGDAANSGGDPWDGDNDTVQLVEAVRFGHDPEDEGE